MTIKRMIELLEIEHECMLRDSHDDCDRNCADCELVQDDGDLHEMYTNVIALLKEQPQIVRCKDCKHFSPGKLYMCRIHGSMFQPKDRNWYCADGESKEGR